MEIAAPIKLVLIALFCSNLESSLEPDKCKTPLGMKSKAIPDSAITASSSYDKNNVGPQYSRIDNEEKGGAWCPKPAVSKDSYEFLQIDLKQLHVITCVETQGRFGKGQGQEYTRFYLLEYQREDNSDWMRFRNRKGEEIIKGNENTYQPEVRNIKPPIIAKRIRFIPYSQSTRTVCLRVEIMGCLWKDGVVSYSMPQGDKRGSDLDFMDFSYDGKTDKYLSGGIGQLLDGQKGDMNFRMDKSGQGIRGYEWVGWKNVSGKSKPIEITFKFDNVRNFSSVSLYCNNMYSKDVSVFRAAHVYFSIGGKYYRKKPIRFLFKRDPVVQFARDVIIRLYHNVGRYVKIVLFFDSRWIMISEVNFKSVPVVGNFTPELPPPTTVPQSRPASRGDNKWLHRNNKGNKKQGYLDVSDIGNNDRSSHIDLNLEGVREKQSNLDKTVRDKKKEKAGSNNSLFGIIGGAAAAVTLLVLVIVVVCWRRRRGKHNHNRRALKDHSNGNHVNGFHMNDMQRASSAKLLNGTMTSSGPVGMDDAPSDHEHYPLQKLLLTNQHDTIQNRRLPEVPLTDLSADSYSRDYAVPDVSQPTMTLPNLPGPSRPVRHKFSTTSLDKPPNYDSLYTTRDLFAGSGHSNIPNLQGVSGNNIYAIPNADLFLTMNCKIREFPRETLQFIEVLGEGQFGEVHLCEAVNCIELLNEELAMNQASSGRGMLVAVKMLRQNADEHARADFHKEIKIMSQLRDFNIVKVLGVCTREEPLCMIVEYMKYGDLHQFLQDHSPGNPMNTDILTYGCMIYIACQIASGMKYLESLNMVHRDLATRNCLVGHNYLIKISDFGMSRSLYSADYYRIEGRAILPIRWMAWESILLGKFTTKSDIWSFAVTLWEILTYALEQPYDALTDEQVIANAGHYYHNNGHMCILPMPTNCASEIYDLMCECWNRQESERPAFKEIHMFLQRKNMGYNPLHEKLHMVDIPVC